MLTFPNRFLLNPADHIGLFHANYDKPLHTLGTFTLLAFTIPVLGVLPGTLFTLSLQMIKTILNYRADSAYVPWGDWLSNGAGFLLYGAYVWFIL